MGADAIGFFDYADIRFDDLIFPNALPILDVFYSRFRASLTRSLDVVNSDTLLVVGGPLFIRKLSSLEIRLVA